MTATAGNDAKMKNVRTLFQEVVSAITLDDPDEIRSMAYLLLAKVADVTRADIVAGKRLALSSDAARILEEYVERINRGEPFQYVVGEAWFYGRRFLVNPSVLIPRPETEELVRAVLGWKNSGQPKTGTPRILDIGTGSGCIPITLFLEWNSAEIFATDVSAAAISVASANAEIHGSKITFIGHDILADRIPISGLDVIVSNPPYVTESEGVTMKDNVLKHEPHLALFVSNDDPLLFYSKIAACAPEALNHGGFVAVEINERFGNEVADVFCRHGFADVRILCDMEGKHRVVTAWKGHEKVC